MVSVLIVVRAEISEPHDHIMTNKSSGSHLVEFTLHPTCTGSDGIRAWFLYIGAPFYAAPLAEILNVSLAMSIIPRQWKTAISKAYVREMSNPPAFD